MFARLFFGLATGPGTSRPFFGCCSCMCLIVCLAALAAEPASAESLANNDSAIVAIVPDSIQKNADSAASVDTLPADTSDTADSLGARDTVTQTQAPVNRIVPPPGFGFTDSTADSLRPIDGFFWGLGAGWSLGSLPVFSFWKRTLPDSLGDFGLNRAFGAVLPDTSDSLLPFDTTSVQFKIKEAPNAYNMTFPLFISIRHFTAVHAFSAGVSFSYASKTFIGSIVPENDSIGRRVDITQKIALYAASLDVGYGWAIPQEYFSVEGVARTSLTAGLSFSPITAIRKTNRLNSELPDQRFAAIGDSILAHVSNLSTNGFSGTLRLGLSSVRQFTKRTALEIAVLYAANWYDYFSLDNRKTLHGDIGPGVSKAGEKLSFLSNRLELQLNLLL